MARGDKTNPKTVIRATDDAIVLYEDIAEDSPDDTPAVLGELLTSKGNPTKGLRRWRLKQKAGLSTDEFSKVLDFLLENNLVELK